MNLDHLLIEDAAGTIPGEMLGRSDDADHSATNFRSATWDDLHAWIDDRRRIAGGEVQRAWLYRIIHDETLEAPVRFCGSVTLGSSAPLRPERTRKIVEVGELT